MPTDAYFWSHVLQGTIMVSIGLLIGLIVLAGVVRDEELRGFLNRMAAIDLLTLIGLMFGAIFVGR